MRGSIVDVYPVTDDHPVRIDLWGDEVDRLSVFAVADQRSTHDCDEVSIFPARELLPTAEVRERAAALVQREPWGAESWERLADGHTFDGMESWLPWLTDAEHLLPDLLPDDALVLLFEPRRMRDRAQELLDEEAALAATLGDHLGRDEAGRRRLAAPVAPVRPPARAHDRRRDARAARARRPGHAAPRRDRVRPGRRRHRFAGAAVARA